MVTHLFYKSEIHLLVRSIKILGLLHASNPYGKDMLYSVSVPFCERRSTLDLEIFSDTFGALQTLF